MQKVAKNRLESRLSTDARHQRLLKKYKIDDNYELGIDRQALSEEVTSVIKATISKLPTLEQRAIAALYVFSDIDTIREMGYILGIGRMTVQRKWAMTKRKLQTTLRD